MTRRVYLLPLYCAIVLALTTVSTMAQNVGITSPRKAVKLACHGVPAANYSGITWLGGDQYAIVCDKQAQMGYFPLTVKIDSLKGRIQQVECGDFHGSGDSIYPDSEGIAYVAATNRLFIASESQQQLVELNRTGELTGRAAEVPPQFSTGAIRPNYGFEALAYEEATSRLWTTTESTLPADGEAASWENRHTNLLRIQAFEANLAPGVQYAYRMDLPLARKAARSYAFGVVAMACHPDGSLWVMEREFHVASRYVGSFVVTKLFRVEMSKGVAIDFSTSLTDLPAGGFLAKELVYTHKSLLTLTKRNLANYEGFCFGPILSDGRQTILLLSDAQGGSGNSLYRMKDYLRILLFDPQKNTVQSTNDSVN